MSMNWLHFVPEIETEGEAEALFDKAVDALRAVYGAPMAAAILDGRARLISKEVNDFLGWPPTDGASPDPDKGQAPQTRIPSERATPNQDTLK